MRDFCGCSLIARIPRVIIRVRIRENRTLMITRMRAETFFFLQDYFDYWRGVSLLTDRANSEPFFFGETIFFLLARIIFHSFFSKDELNV